MATNAVLLHAISMPTFHTHIEVGVQTGVVRGKAVMGIGAVAEQHNCAVMSCKNRWRHVLITVWGLVKTRCRGADLEDAF